MTKKVLYTDFTGIDEVISDILEDKSFKKAITRNNLFKFWKQIVGDKFKNKSKPYSMTKNSVMIIACDNPVTAQELMLRKTTILNDFKPYLKSLKITVNDLRFDPKRWIAEES